MHSLLAATLGAMSACVSFPPTGFDVTTTIYVAPSAEHLTGRVIAAADWLNREVGVHVYEVLTACTEKPVDGAAVVRVAEELVCAPHELCLAGVTTRTANGVIIDVTPNPSISIIAHELGHAAGLEHDNDPDNFMFYMNPGMRINDSQKEALRGH